MSDHNNDNNNQGPLTKKPCHLKLVASNPVPAQEEPSFKTDPNLGFTVDADQEDGADVLAVCDHFHRLLCRVPLEIDDSGEYGETGSGRSVVCDFPRVLGEQVNEFEGLNSYTGEDIFGMVTDQFHMKLLEQALLFASGHDASSLVVRIKEGMESDALWVYQHLASYEDRVPIFSDIRAQLVILTHSKTFDELIDLMDQSSQKFRRALWREQRRNPFIRWYLKKDPSLKFF